jgi:hypothetical protein
MRLIGLMVTTFGTFLALASAQPRVADDREYQLIRRAGLEGDATKQLGVLQEWEAAYPKTELQRMRDTMFVDVYRRLGQPTDAFARAAQLFHLNSKDITASALVSWTAPSLKAPSLDQLKTTQEAAANLLIRAADLRRTAGATARTGNDTQPDQVSDPDLQRLSIMISEWRRENPNLGAPDFISLLNAAAERALAWAESVSK